MAQPRRGEPQDSALPPRLCPLSRQSSLLPTHLPLLEHAGQEGVFSSSERQKIDQQQHTERVVLWIKASEGGERKGRKQKISVTKAEGAVLVSKSNETFPLASRELP